MAANRLRSPCAVGLVLAALVSLGVGFLPLLAGPGYEQALIAGVVMPSLAAVCVALQCSARGSESAVARPLFGLGYGASVATLVWIIAMLHGLRASACALASGSVYYALTAGVGTLLGGAWGGVASFVASALRRRKLAAWLVGLALPVGCIFITLARYYDSPIIFAYDPFFGYFSGTLYDTIIDPGVQLYTQRLGSAGWLLFALAALGTCAYRRGDTGRGRIGYDTSLPRAQRVTLLVFAATGLVVGIVVYARGEALGHRASARYITETLGGKRSGPRCDIVAPKTETGEVLDLLVQDCEASLARVEKVMGARGPERITAFFFRDAVEKKRFMGAFNTYVAKPWRGEVYIQGTSYPQQVLGHELAHVVAGSFGHGPFRVAGKLGGLWPDPGLIEGIAEAASPHDDEVTDASWSRAMLDLNLLPSPSRIFSLGFLADSSQKSYTVAGAFIAFLGDKYGWAAVRRWYSGEDLAAAIGKSKEDIDGEFRVYLKTLTISDETREHARARFERPGVFGRRCPHLIDALRHEAEACSDGARFEEAITIYGRALAEDDNDFVSRLARAGLQVKFGTEAERASGERELTAMVEDKRYSRPVRDRALEAVADGRMMHGGFDAAAKVYVTLASTSLDEDFARTIDVKLEGCRAPEMRPMVMSLLFTEDSKAPNPAVFAYEMARAPHTSLTLYLIARQFSTRGYHARALAVFDEVAREHLEYSTRRITREALRLEGISACAMRDRARIERLVARLAGDDSATFSPDSGKKRGLSAILASCVP